MNCLTATTAALIGLTAVSAHAETVTMQNIGIGAGSSVRFSLGEIERDVFAGELIHQVSGATGDFAFLNGTITTFCPDITEHVAESAEEFEIVDVAAIPLADGLPAMGAVRADALRTLYATNMAALTAESMSASFATAFQVTIWEIVNDFDGSVSSIDTNAGDLRITLPNGFELTGAIQAQVDSFKIGLAANLGTTSFDGLIGFANEGAQDQLYVPAPGALALLGLGSLTATRRRRA